MPTGMIQDNTQFEKPETTRWQGFTTAIKNGMFDGTTSSIYDTLHAGFAEGIPMTKEAWKQSPFYRDGLNFEDGVTDTTARIAAQRYDREKTFNETMNTMPDGLLSSMSRGAGDLIGFSLDPVNAVSATLAPELVGTKVASWATELMGTRAYWRAASALGGIAEGASVFAPNTLATYNAEKTFGEDPSPYMALLNLGAASALGGVVHGVFGMKSVMPEHEYRVGLQTAVAQMAAGKAIDLDLLNKNAAYQDFLQTMVARSPLKERQNVLDEVKNLFSNRKALEDVVEQQQYAGAESGITHADSINMINDRLEEIAAKYGAAIEPEFKKVGGLKNLLAKATGQTTKEFRDMYKSEYKPTVNVINKTEEEISNEIKGNIDGARAQEHKLDNVPDAVTKEDILAANEKIKKPAADFSYDREAAARYEQFAKENPEERALLEQDQAEVDQLAERGLLGDEDMAEIKAADDAIDRGKLEAKAIKQLTRCLGDA